MAEKYNRSKFHLFLLKFPTNFACVCNLIKSSFRGAIAYPLCNFQQLYLMLYSNYGVLSQFNQYQALVIAQTS